MMSDKIVKRAPKKKGANAYKLPDPISAGEILTDMGKKQWILGVSIGIGGFGEIYSGIYYSYYSYYYMYTLYTYIYIFNSYIFFLLRISYLIIIIITAASYNGKVPNEYPNVIKIVSIY